MLRRSEFMKIKEWTEQDSAILKLSLKQGFWFLLTLGWSDWNWKIFSSGREQLTGIKCKGLHA